MAIFGTVAVFVLVFGYAAAMIYADYLANK